MIEKTLKCTNLAVALLVSILAVAQPNGEVVEGVVAVVGKNIILKSDFKFSNMSLGLFNYNQDNLLDLFEKDGKMKLIYKIIHHNYIGIFKTIEIMNGKYYINNTHINGLRE